MSSDQFSQPIDHLQSDDDDDYQESVTDNVASHVPSDDKYLLNSPVSIPSEYSYQYETDHSQVDSNSIVSDSFPSSSNAPGNAPGHKKHKRKEFNPNKISNLKKFNDSTHIFLESIKESDSTTDSVSVTIQPTSLSHQKRLSKQWLMSTLDPTSREVSAVKASYGWIRKYVLRTSLTSYNTVRDAYKTASESNDKQMQSQMIDSERFLHRVTLLTTLKSLLSYAKTILSTDISLTFYASF